MRFCNSKWGGVIAKAFNSQRASKDATAHAEITAIREAGMAVGNKNLDGCTIYCTCEPCTMCLSAIMFAKISRLVYGVSLQGACPAGKPIEIDIDTFLSKTAYKIEVVKNFMIDECKKLII